MTSEDRIHQLLPWYTTGTLDRSEADRFRAHLPGCEACREEIEAVGKIEAELERHGRVFLEGHPDPERLVDAVSGALGDAEKTAVTRHLAVCASCAEEARWVTGQAVAKPRRTAPAAPAGAQRWLWPAVAAAAVVVALVAVLAPGRQPGPGVLRPWLVTPVERATGGTNVFELGGAGRTVLVFEIDLPTGAFPAELDITDAAGSTVLRQTIGREQLVESYLYLDVPRGHWKPGTYEARIAPAAGGRPLRFGFELRP